MAAARQRAGADVAQFRRLGVQGVEQEDVKKPAAVEIGELVEQAQSGRVFALSGL